MKHCPNILFYDAACMLCTRSVRFVLQRDKRKQICVAALDSKLFVQLSQNKGLEREDSVMLYDGRQFHSKSRAVIRILSLLPYPWKALTIFRYLPQKWSDALYDYIAARRSRWFSPRKNCWLPPAEMRARIL